MPPAASVPQPRRAASRSEGGLDVPAGTREHGASCHSRVSWPVSWVLSSSRSRSRPAGPMSRSPRLRVPAGRRIVMAVAAWTAGAWRARPSPSAAGEGNSVKPVPGPRCAALACARLRRTPGATRMEAHRTRASLQTRGALRTPEVHPTRGRFRTRGHLMGAARTQGWWTQGGPRAPGARPPFRSRWWMVEPSWWAIPPVTRISARAHAVAPAAGMWCTSSSFLPGAATWWSPSSRSRAAGSSPSST